MLLSFGVVDGLSHETHHVEVAAQPASRVKSLLVALPIPVEDRACFVGSESLDPAATLADSPLVGGVTLTVGEPGPDARGVPLGAVGLLGVIAGPDAGRGAGCRREITPSPGTRGQP